jgi:hypothetical protein
MECVQLVGLVMTALGPHKKRLHRVVPDQGYVMKYTDQGPYPGNHWFWRDGRRNHGHDARGQAYVRWRVKPTAESGYFTHGDFNVARLLITALRGPIPPRARVANLCGLSQCINPGHWEHVLPKPRWRIQVFDGDAWQLVHPQSGQAAQREVVVSLLHQGTVHLATISPHAARSAKLRTVCGHEPHPMEVVVTTADVSCAGCL